MTPFSNTGMHCRLFERLKEDFSSTFEVGPSFGEAIKEHHFPRETDSLAVKLTASCLLCRQCRRVVHQRASSCMMGSPHVRSVVLH